MSEDNSNTEVKQEVIDVTKIRAEARKAETFRVKEISALAEKANCREFGKEAISNGMELDQFRAEVIEKHYKAIPVQAAESAEIGMSKKEMNKYSIFRAVQAIVERNWDLAPLEKEVSDTIAKRTKRTANGFFVADDIMKRDLSAGTDANGGYTVQTDVGSMIDILRNSLITRKLGATYLEGLTGDLALPRHKTAATGYWVAEGSQGTESTQVLEQISFTPKHVTTWTDITKQLMMQSSIDVENFVRRDLMEVLARSIDTAAINGRSSTSLTSEPKGIMNDTAVNTVTAGTSLAGAALTWADIVNMETEVANDNAAFGNLAYLTNSKVRGKLKQTLTSSLVGARYIWDVNSKEINGYPAEVSNIVPSTLAQASTSLSSVANAVIFGNWRDLAIAMWGGLDLAVNPYTLMTYGMVRIVARQMCDVKLFHPESFCVIDDALTA